jgi:hypothetical protein
MDHQAAKVWLNGVEAGATPCLWTVTESLEFDPKIPIGQWPPEGARFVGSTQDREIPDHKAELYIGAKLPPRAPGECVVYVSASIGGRPFQGAMRLRVDGCHDVDYTPLVNPEGEEASRFLRTIWFERTQNE